MIVFSHQFDCCFCQRILANALTEADYYPEVGYCSEI
jgi:hypothetical protein